MNQFKSHKKEDSILDCFTYDLKTFFYDQYEEIDSEETPATIMIVYEKNLAWKELNIFDTIQFRIFFDKDNLTGSNPINVKFITKEKELGLDKLSYIVGKILGIYGKDDFEKEDWSQEDEEAYQNNNYRRVWTIDKGESFINIEKNEKEGITLSILFFNNLLKSEEETIDLKL